MLRHHRPGQSMLEMIIAVGVITISTLATTTLIITTITTGRVSQARIEAVNLAREGVEIVRGIRDSNWLKADQNVIDGASGTTVAWNDSGSTSDGLIPLNGTYVAQLNNGTGRWTLISSGTCTSTNLQLVTPGAGQQYQTQCLASCTGTCRSTRYTRTITITPAQENVHIYPWCPDPQCFMNIDYLAVTATVSSPGALTTPIKVSERLYNWK